MIQNVEASLQALSASQPFDTAWAVHDIARGVAYTRDGNLVVPAASTRKIPILMACLSAVAEKRLDLDRRVVIQPHHQENDSGLVCHLRPFLSLTLFDALTLMTIVSDNCCTMALMELLGFERLLAWSEECGFTGMRHVAGTPANSFMNHPTPTDMTQMATTTPDDMCRLLRMIIAGIDSAADAARLRTTPVLCTVALDIMSRQQYRASIPKLLPVGTRVAHKTGWGRSCENDAGIVFNDKGPLYVIAAYTRNVPPLSVNGLAGRALAMDFIGDLSAICWLSMN
ncbi:serine hydrolase [Bradyrhizobium diazoefficiens]|nr:serine hydrolase [Bradyrhizobium diazoefficiens]QQO23691.1 serine hydrolase [Bradyrhizobium diazoefficiens]